MKVDVRQVKRCSSLRSLHPDFQALCTTTLQQITNPCMTVLICRHSLTKASKASNVHLKVNDGGTMLLIPALASKEHTTEKSSEDSIIKTNRTADATQ